MNATQRIGKYKILGELGQGGMGIVYKAHDTMIGRDVALKIIHKHALRVPEIRERFYREAKSAGRLSHENIMILHDIFEEDGIPCLVMELLNGTDLRTVMSRGKALTLPETLRIARQICLGLHYAHEQQIVHRDVKPDNIRVLESGRVKIMDFGIARIQSETRLTQHNASLGTPRYMAPEQIMSKEIDRRVDIFSFGVVLYELLTGTNPFSSDHVTTVIYKILSEHPEPIRLEDSPFSDGLQAIVSKCLKKDSKDRYPHFGRVIEDLDALFPAAFESTATLTRPLTSRIGAMPTVSDETVALHAPTDPTLLDDRAARTGTGPSLVRPSTKRTLFSKRSLVLAGLLLVVLAGGSYATVSALRGPDTPGEAIRENLTNEVSTDRPLPLTDAAPLIVTDTTAFSETLDPPPPPSSVPTPTPVSPARKPTERTAEQPPASSKPTSNQTAVRTPAETASSRQERASADQPTERTQKTEAASPVTPQEKTPSTSSSEPAATTPTSTTTPPATDTADQPQEEETRAPEPVTPDLSPTQMIQQEARLLRNKLKQSILTDSWTSLPTPVSTFYRKKIERLPKNFTVTGVGVEIDDSQLQRNGATASLPITVRIDCKQKGRDGIKSFPIPSVWVWEDKQSRMTLIDVQ